MLTGHSGERDARSGHARGELRNSRQTLQLAGLPPGVMKVDLFAGVFFIIKLSTWQVVCLLLVLLLRLATIV